MSLASLRCFYHAIPENELILESGIPAGGKRKSGICLFRGVGKTAEKRLQKEMKSKHFRADARKLSKHKHRVVALAILLQSIDLREFLCILESTRAPFEGTSKFKFRLIVFEFRTSEA